MPSQMRRRLKVARDGASSRNHNPRNLEHLWYVFWSIIASRIAGRINSMNIFVAPQFPVWRLWIDDEDPIEVAAIEFRDDSAMDTTDYYLMGEDEDGDEDEDEDELEEANTSLPSVVATDKSNNRGRITDFALICWDSDYLVSTGSASDEESDDEEVLSEEAVPKYDDIVPVLIEIKRMPSRKYAHPHLTTEFVELMSTAKLHAGRQATYLFLNTRYAQTSVLAIAAVGDYWSYTVIDKGKTAIDLNDIGDSSAEDWEPIIIFEAEGWSDIMKYGSATSNKAEDEVVTWIDEQFPETKR